MVEALSSGDSAEARAPLFAALTGRMAPSDFFKPFIIGFGFLHSLPAPLRHVGQSEDLPGSRHKACERAWVLRHRGVRRHLTKAMPAMLPSTDLKASAPRINAFSVLNSPAHSYRYRRFACPSRGPTHGSRRNVVWLLLRFGDLHPLPSASSPGAPDPRMPARARGSYLGCVTANRRFGHGSLAVSGLSPVSHLPGTASGVCFDLPNSPWLRPFPPAAPQSLSLPCSPLSQVVRPHPTLHPVHHRIRLSPSLCGPGTNTRAG